MIKAIDTGGKPSASFLDNETQGHASHRTVAERFALLASALLKEPGVTISDRPGFSKGGLMVGGKLFAALHGETLLLKLPAAHVSTLLREGGGRPMHSARGRPMMEWVLAEPDQNWESLATTAAVFVANGSSGFRRR